MQVDELRGQLGGCDLLFYVVFGVSFFSMWYYIQPGFGTLARKHRLVMNWHSFLGCEYSFLMSF